jgi:hypothetical protein
MSNAARLVIFCFAVVSLFQVKPAHAQLYNPRSASISSATTNYLVNRPTVSPYLNLLRPESETAMPNYQTLVRPVVERRRQASRQAATIGRLQSRVTNMQGQMAGQRRGSQFTTGHPSRFMSYLHYYPSLGPR